MAPAPAPNHRLARLIAVIGEADTRELVGIYLDSIQPLMRDLASGDPALSLRAAHSLKSSSGQMGVTELSERMAALEERLREPGATVTPGDLEGAAADFAQAEGALRAFVGTPPPTP